MLNDFDKLLSWCRYLFWSDLLYQRFVEHDETTYTNSSVAESLTFALSSQWLANMYVVIEGWKELSLSDLIIDELRFSASVRDKGDRVVDSLFPGCVAARAT